MIYSKEEVHELEKPNAEIALIAPTDELARKAEAIIKERNEYIDIHTSEVKKDAVEDALRIARQYVDKGIKIIISRKGTAVAIKEAKLEVTVVVINTILSDYIKAMETAKKFKGIIAFFSYDEMTEDVKSACQMLGINAKFYTFKSDKDSEKKVKEAIRDGAILGIGGAMTDKYSNKHNLEHITIENSEISIITALENAQQLLLIKKEEFKKQIELKLQLKRYQAILDFTHDAIIATDEDGIINVMNPVAEDIAKIPPGYGIGKKVNEIIKNSKMGEILDVKEKQLNEVMNINGTLVSTNRIPIVINNKIKGVVATFQDIKTIQENENKIRRTLHKKGLVAKYKFEDIKGESEVLKNTIGMAKSYALSDSTILILGETGTGKELFAQSIHNTSNRKDGPFVAINCAALSKSLLESELFGYEEGAFTGAIKGGKIGLFELAHKGTIFLDEIGEIPIEIQAQLLRVIQEKEIRRIGSEFTTPVDIRIITATNRDLKDQVEKNKFREDLYYRISVLNLHLPPLRDRGEDIKKLSGIFFEEFLGSNPSNCIDNYNTILDKFKGYEWYGNIRELRNLIERISVLLQHHGDDDQIENIIDEFLVNKRNEDIQYANKDLDLKDWEFERIVEALKRNNLSIQKTAKDLDISRTTLWRKMKEYNIECN